MRLIGLILMAAGLLAQTPLPSPFIGGSGGGGGSGTVTSVRLAGTSNQITVTGSTPITGSGSWTLSLPSAVTFPGSATVTDTFAVGTSVLDAATSGIAAGGLISGTNLNINTKFTGPSSTLKTFTLPNADATLLYSGGALGTPSSGVGTNLTGIPAASILPGTFGAGNYAVNGNLTALNVGNVTINATFAPYYASGSATTTTTSGAFGVGTSGTITSCTSFSANQGIYIAGAGAAGVDYVGTVVSCSAGALVITPTTSTSVANGTLVQHDDTAAIQAAINAIASTGGIIFLPDGIYNINGPRQDTGGSNSRLLTPSVAVLSNWELTIPPTIEIMGQTPQGYSFSNPASNLGTILRSNQSGGSMIGTYGPSSIAGNTSSIYVYLHNLTFRMPDNPNQTAVDLSNAVYGKVENCNFDTNIAQYSQTLPSHTNGRALLMPGLNNYTLSHVKNVWITGYYDGITLGEHAVLDNVSLYQVYRAIVPIASPHSWYANRIAIQHCPYGIYVTSQVGAEWLSISELEFEHWTSNGGIGNTWAGTIADVYDPGNNLHGKVYWHGTSPNFVPADSFLAITGASNLAIYRLDTAAQDVPIPAPVVLIDAATVTWATNGNKRNLARVMLGGARTLSITGPADAARGDLWVYQDATGGRTLALPSGSFVRGVGQGAITLSPTAYAVDRLTWEYDAVAGTYSWDYALGLTASNSKAPYGLLDTLHGAAQNATFWGNGSLLTGATFDAAVTIVASTSGITVTPRSSFGGVGYNGYLTASTFNFTGGVAQVRVNQVTANSTFADTYLLVGVDASNVVFMQVQAAVLSFEKVVTGSRTSVATAVYTRVGTVDPTKLYWRIRESGGTIYGDYSADNITWTNLGSTTVSWSLSAVKADLEAGTYQSVASPGAALFDLFQLTPGGTASAVPTSTLSGTTGSISGALTIGACDSGTATVTGATTGMAVVASPVTYPGDGAVWNGYVSSADTVTVKLCGLATLTPSASVFNVRVVP